MRDQKAEIKIRIYRDTDLPRKIKCMPFWRRSLMERDKIFNEELKRRGKIKKYEKIGYKKDTPILDVSEILENANSRIRWVKGKRDYSIDNLSMLSLIECFFSEGWGLDLDLIKLEILLVLFHEYDVFRDIEKAMELYYEQGMDMFKLESDLRTWVGSNLMLFLDYLYLYLFDIGKMLVTELNYDFFINKAFGEEITLKENKTYDKKYNYFSKISYYFLV